MPRFLLLVICYFVFGSSLLLSQNTVGLIDLKPGETYPGYNLIYSHNQPNVYLLDQCGEIVHTWTDTDNWRPGNTAYILPNGNLVKAKRDEDVSNGPIVAGGLGQIVEIRDWSNTLLHSYELNDSLARLHHDIAPMPNGNVLLIAWERKTEAEALAAGRLPELLSQGELWSESVLEWDPEKNAIIWRWRLWDHLIQDVDPNLPNYGVVADHPELVDINYQENDGAADWLHMNSIDYNPYLDQILLSNPHINEIWIIDHSTTFTEGTGHTGGNAGKGGDLLFRWGNPVVYAQGDKVTDKKLFFQHGVEWVNPGAEPGDPEFGQIAVYNNRAPGNRSPGQIIATQPNTTNFSYPKIGAIFGPVEFARKVSYPGEDQRATSAVLSSVQFLPNGNALLMAGRWGFAYELNPAGEVVWNYIIPFKAGLPAVQGDTLGITDNLSFSLDRYALDYPAFVGKDLSPQGYLELEANEAFCDQLLPVHSQLNLPDDVRVYPNPTRDLLIIELENEAQRTAILVDINGRILQRIPLQGPKTIVPTTALTAGIYWLKVPGSMAKKVVIMP